MSAPRARDARWLFGAAPDLLLGCGLAYLGVLAVQAAVGSGQLSAWVPAGILVMAASIPHYGATLLRVYESSEDRRKYVLFAVHATLAVAIAFVVGLRSVAFGSVVLTLYLTWSPWHYSGQNYGILLMILGRRGVAVSPDAKRWIYASFILSFVLTVLAVHGAEPGGHYAPVSYQGTAYRLLPLGIPAPLTTLLVAGVAVGWLASLGAAAVLLLRAAPARALAPAALLALTQAVWFAVPVLLRSAGVTGVAAGVYTGYGFIWIAAAHAVQYLWVSAYYARASGAAPKVLPYLGKAVLAGYAVWVLPALIFAPALLGRLPYESGLALLVAACVNLHHFILDGAIWKLRDGRVARFLLRPAQTSAAPGAIPAHARRWRPVPALVWAAGALALAVSVFGFLEGDLARRRAVEGGDVERLRTAVQRLSWIGRDGPAAYRDLGRLLAREGDLEGARAALERSIGLHPTQGAWLSLASLAELEGDWGEAQRAYQRALELGGDNPHALYRSGVAWLRLGEPERARRALERARSLAPDRAEIQASLEQAIREGGAGRAPGAAAPAGIERASRGG